MEGLPSSRRAACAKGMSITRDLTTGLLAKRQVRNTKSMSWRHLMQVWVNQSNFKTLAQAVVNDQVEKEENVEMETSPEGEDSDATALRVPGLEVCHVR